MPRNLLALVIGAFLDIGVTYAAAAADVPIRTPVYAPPVLYNWSGLYLGANVGGAWSNRTVNVAGTAWDDPFSSAFIGGFQLGYNLQAGHFVVGVEGDFDWASFGRPSFTVSSPLGPVQFSDRQKWISTVAARFGITSGSGRLLAYGKVGGGWAQDSAALTVPSGMPIWTGSNTSGGWLFGGGLEYGLKPNWTVKLEYDYLKLGDWTTSTVPAVSWRRDTQMIKVGVNYKFERGGSDDATLTPDDQAGSSRAKGRDIEELAKASQNPVASLIAVPFRLETTPNVGPFNRTQNVLTIRPVVPISVNDQWNIISRTVIPVTSQPNPLIDSSTNGTGDATVSLFLTPVDSGIKDFYWGFGPIIGAPSASDAILGDGKAGLGPTFAVFYRPEHWVIGMIANNQWSVGGAPGRTSVNFFTAEYVINYNIPGGEGWYLNSSPLVTVNWTAAPGQQWTVPVGGGLGRVFKVGDQSFDASVQGFYHLIHPNNGPTWSTRVQVSLLFPDR
jgi:opacity protein-like surface antigen